MTDGAVVSRSRLLKLLRVLGPWALGVAAVPLLGTGFTFVRPVKLFPRPKWVRFAEVYSGTCVHEVHCEAKVGRCSQWQRRRQHVVHG